jgi:hypothetical protein
MDSTIRNDTGHLELIRDWFGRPLWEMQPADADTYFGKLLRDAKPSTRTGRAAALTVYFDFLELRHKVEIYNLTGRVVECPLDEMNRPRASVERHGKGSRRRGPKPRLVPLINGADRNMRWFIEDVWGQFDADPARPGAPLFPSERKCQDGSGGRATADVLRRSLATAAEAHLPAWAGKLTPHVPGTSAPHSCTCRA